MCSYVFLCVLMCSYVFLCVLMCSYVFLCVLMCSYVFLCVLMCSYVFLCVLMCSYVFLCVLMCSYVFLRVRMCSYVFHALESAAAAAFALIMSLGIYSRVYCLCSLSPGGNAGEGLHSRDTSSGAARHVRVSQYSHLTCFWSSCVVTPGEFRALLNIAKLYMWLCLLVCVCVRCDSIRLFHPRLAVVQPTFPSECSHQLRRPSNLK